MDPLQTNGYFLYTALEELWVLKEFSRVKRRRHEDFSYNMLGFVFKNSVSKAVFKMIGLDEQLKTIRASVDHIQTNLAQVWAHGNMAAMKPLGKKATKDGVDIIK